MILGITYKGWVTSIVSSLALLCIFQDIARPNSSRAQTPGVATENSGKQTDGAK